MGRPPSYDRLTALDTAMKLFWKQGYLGTSLKDLENALSMRPGSIYAAFHSKEALYRECIELYRSNLLKQLHDLADSEAGPFAGLKACLLFFSDLSEDEQVSHCMMVKAILETAEDAFGEVLFVDVAKKILDEIQSVITNSVRRSQDAGEIDPSLDATGTGRRLFSTAIGLRTQKMLHIGDAELETALREDLILAIDCCRSKQLA